MADIRSQAKSITIATATMTVDPDPVNNRLRVRQVIEETLEAHPRVRLFHFGETILGLFHKPGETQAYHESIAEPVPGPSTDYISDVAREHDVYISFGLTEEAGGNLYNTLVLISPEGEILATHRKFWIVNKFFSPGELALTTVDVDGFNVAILVCADARSRTLIRMIRRDRPDVVLVGLADLGTDVLASQFIGSFFDAWAFAANRYGEEGKMTWRGLTTITDPWARVAQASVGRECVLIQDVPFHQSSAVERFIRRALVSIKAAGLLVSMMVRKALG